jgi:hypothetical protein
MSTKSTIVYYGSSFHLYHELADEDSVYLELEGVHFETSYNRVVVPIPVHIWEVIRAFAGVDLSWADWTDEELRAYVERRVDERLARAAQAGSDSVARLLGMAIYGDLDAPREEQIARGIRHAERERDHQRQIVAAIEELRRRINAPPSQQFPSGTAPRAEADADTEAQADA